MRKALVTAHLWLGLIIGFFWAVQGFTGALFVFSREMDRFFLPTPTSGSMVNLDALVAAARSVAPDAKITRLSVADRYQDTVNVLYDDTDGVKRAVVVDGASGTVVGAREMAPLTPFTGSASRWLYTTHLTLMGGDRGQTLVGISGLFLVTAALTGLWIAWPRRGSWKATFQWRRWRKLDHQLYGWHRALGLSAGVLFIAMGLTGAFLALPEEPVRQFAARFVPYEPIFSQAIMHHNHGPFRTPDPTTVISPQRALETALEKFPKAHWVRVFMPSVDMPIYIVRLYQPGEIRAWLGATEVMVDARDGRVTGVFDALHAPVANKIFDGSFDFHSGALAAWPGRILIMLLGFSLPAMYVTGVWAWLRKRRRKATARLAAQCDPALPPRPR